jgi:MFS family permease
VPLTITSVRGRTTAVASIAVTAATLSWTAGSWLQERRCRTWSSRRLVTMGLAIVVAGIACFAGVLFHGAPLALAFAGWTIGGFGIGLAYAPISVVVLREAPDGQQGLATASMQLADNLGVALGAGVGGAAIALGQAQHWPLGRGLAAAFAMAGTVGIIGVAVARRLPVQVVGGPDPVRADGYSHPL